jgi:hypothetical protein
MATKIPPNTIIIIILSLLIIILPYLNNKIKFNVHLIGSNNMATQVLVSNLILFTLLEDITVGLLLLVLFITILTLKKKNITEGFETYYKKNNIL